MDLSWPQNTTHGSPCRFHIRVPGLYRPVVAAFAALGHRQISGRERPGRPALFRGYSFRDESSRQNPWGRSGAPMGNPRLAPDADDLAQVLDGSGTGIHVHMATFPFPAAVRFWLR